LGWSVPAGRRQTPVSLPAWAQARFFSDGLIEARCADGLLGCERLSEILAALGPRPQAADLLERVRSAAEATPDDMVACILAPQAPAGDKLVHVEALEADARQLPGGPVGRLLGDCEVPPSEIASTIERADVIAGASGTALLRIERRPTGPARAIVAAPGPGAEASRTSRPTPGRRTAACGSVVAGRRSLVRLGRSGSREGQPAPGRRCGRAGCREERAVVAVHDYPPGVARPRPVPCPTSLVVKNGSKMRPARSVGNARAVVGDLDHRTTPVGPRRDRDRPPLPSASIALSSRFVHTWLGVHPRTVSRGSERS
jgi:hypothetical protein